jgi:hypothetical protein
LAQQLVNNPDAVEVKETRDDDTTLLELRVVPEDFGQGNRQAGPYREVDSHDPQRGRSREQLQG